MKRIFYHMACWLAVLGCAACSNETDFVKTEADNNSIVLDISSATTPVTRAGATGAEVTVSYVDVLIFDDTDNKSLAHYERVQVVADSQKSGKITLAKAQRKDFTANESYWVYLIANSTLGEDKFQEVADLGKLRGLMEEQRNIHMTGAGTDPEIPMIFLMDGIAYPAGTNEPETPGKVVLYNGNLSDKTELAVTLRRAAAKIVVKIKKGKDVIFDNSPEAYRAGYYLRNMPYSTTLIPNPDANDNVKLWTPDRSASKYFAWTENEITVTAYAYSYNWKDKPLERETRLVVNIPLYYKTETDLRGDNYYQIPISKEKVLERNTYYEVTVEVNAPGATEILKPEELEPVNYTVQAWDETIINVGGETDRPKYLTVNEEEMEMYNISDDNTTLEFASSSEVSVKVTRVYYIDKFGQTQATTSEREIARMGINVVPDKGLNGNINIHSPLPTNNTIRYIELEITNEDGVEARKVTVAQYPLEYIVNIQSWYSYRDDFKINDSRPTTYDYMGDRVYGISLATRSISNWNGNYDYEVSSGFGWFEDASNGFFRSKVVTKIVAGKSTILHYYWNSRGVLSTSESGEYNGRLYHITITSTSDKYTIGNPRQIRDETTGLLVTDPGTDNAELVSPSFMIASSLGGFMLGAGNLTLDNSANSLRVAREHCANYVEVAHDGTIYDDWRLPTRAELEIIMNFQGKEDEDADAIDYLLNAKYYYSANGRVENSKSNMNGTGVRCIRDAFDTQK